MDVPARPNGVSLNHTGMLSLSVLSPGATGSVVSVGTSEGEFTPIERRLIELGFVHGEHIEVIAQARPGGDPFVVRVGTTTFALRRREVESVWVEPAPVSTPP